MCGPSIITPGPLTCSPMVPWVNKLFLRAVSGCDKLRWGELVRWSDGPLYPGAIAGSDSTVVGGADMGIVPVAVVTDAIVATKLDTPAAATLAKFR